MMWVEWAWLIPVIPLVAFPFILFFGKKSPKEGGLIAVVAVGVAFLLSLLVVVDVSQGNLPAAEPAAHGGAEGGGAAAPLVDALV